MKNIFTILFTILAFSLFSQETIDLFVWSGQSNALGRQGDAAGYPADPNNIDDDIRFNWTVANGANSSGWTTMQPQVGYFDSGHFGPEVTFSRGLVQAGYNPAIVKFTQGATSIFQHWQGPGDGGLYDDMVANLNTAITALENQGHTVNVRCLIWIQGESDSNTDASANAYFANLTSIINDFRSNVVNDADLPIILGVDEQFFNITGRERHKILNSHQDIALNDTNIKFTSMYGYPKADATHLTPAGLIDHGADLFDSFELLVSGQTPNENCTLSSSGTEVSFERVSWGQSFTTDCSGNLGSITFSAASIPEGTVTFTLHNGADCSGTVLFTKSLDFMTVGDNIVEIPNDLYLDKEHSYYINIVSDLNEVWSINYSQTDNIFGVLRTFQDGSNCGRTFLDFDMDFSVVLGESGATGECTISSSGSVVSFERSAWGQSFITDCAGGLSTITFSSATNHSTSATFTVHDGADCNATVLYTTTLNSISIGDNIVDITDDLSLENGQTYYFNVVSDAGSVWTIHYSNTSNVAGLLTTFQNGSNCGQLFPSFDMNFSVLVEESGSTNECTISSSGSEVSFERSAWGQSFVTDCSGDLSSITFSAATNHTTSATFTVHDGADCNATVSYTKTLNSISIGDNVVNITDDLSLENGQTYYFNVVSDAGSFWEIHYSNTSNVAGLLTTFKDGSNCGRLFPSFDMNFAVVVAESSNNECANPAYIYEFSYDGRNYEVVKEKKTWVAAAECAVERGGILAEINDQAEQDAIFNELQNANITLANTVAINGGGASYVWIGANDMDTQLRWVWNGNNDANSIHFWQGLTGGNPVNGLYSNWGKEPDNAGNVQDAAAIALTRWPIGSGSLGSAGEWNDLNEINNLYYVIEYAPTGLEIPSLNEIGIYPNPVHDSFTIDSKGKIFSLKIFSSVGMEVKYIAQLNGATQIDVSDLQGGLYFLQLETANGMELYKLVVE